MPLSNSSQSHPRTDPRPLARPWAALFANASRTSSIIAFILVVCGWTLKLTPALTSVDAAIGASIRSSLPASFGPFTDAIAQLCGMPGAVLVLAALMTGVLVARSSFHDALTFGALVVGGCVACWVIKALVQRPAPGVHAGLDSTGQSFPSGHVAFATSVAVTLWLLVRRTRWATPLAIVSAGLVLTVAASRIYLDVHYPTDTIAGVAVAIAGVGLAGVGVRAARRSTDSGSGTLERKDNR